MAKLYLGSRKKPDKQRELHCQIQLGKADVLPLNYARAPAPFAVPSDVAKISSLVGFAKQLPGAGMKAGR